MQRLSALDAEFLNLEDGVAHMHIAGLCVFDDPPPSLADLTALIESKLHLIPRYRQRIRNVPLDLGRPVWVDDPHFCLEYHLRHTALPAPGDDGELTRLMGRLMSQPLDRARPLWEAWLVEGISAQRWGLVFKVHHCMVDGIAGVELLTVLLDADADTEVGRPEPWDPEVEPNRGDLVLDAWWGLTGDLAAGLRELPGAVLHPADTVRSLTRTGEGLVRFLRNLYATPLLSIEGGIGPHRVWAHSTASLGDVRAIRTAFGGTVNDVVLTAVAGGYRQLLMSRREDVDRAVVRTMVPVSVRTEDSRHVPDNEVSTLLYELPVHIEDPVERLREVRRGMKELKGSHMAEAGAAVATIGNLAPPMLVSAITRLALRSERVLPQRVINTVTTNVPGPQFPIFCLGREMRAYFPYVGLSYGVRVSTAVLSYNGHLFFGITGDYDAAPDVDVVANAAAEVIGELRERALAPTARADLRNGTG